MQLTLHIDTPSLGVKTEDFQGTLLAEPFSFINVLVAAVVSRPRVSFGVLVLHNTAKCFQDRPGGKVLRWDKIDKVPLSIFFLESL
jgi:hypothetical protein